MLLFEKNIFLKIRKIHKRDFNYLKGGIKKFFKKTKKKINIYTLNLVEGARPFLSLNSNQKIEGLEFKILKKHDDGFWDFYTQIADEGISQNFVDNKLLPNNEAIVVASLSKAVVGAVFISHKKHPILGINADLVFGDGHVYIAYIYIKKSFRSKGLGTCIVEQAIKFCADIFFRRCIMAIYPDNIASQNIALKCGFKKNCCLIMDGQFFARRYRCHKEEGAENLGIQLLFEDRIVFKF